MSDEYQVEVSDFDIDVNAKIQELGYELSNSVKFLPYNFEESTTKKDMVYTMPEIVMGKAFNMMDVKTDFLTGQKELKPLDEIDTLIINIMIPTCMFLMFPILLKILSGQLSIYYQKEQIGINFILEKVDGKMKKIAYFGPLDKLKESKKEIIEISKDLMGLSSSDITKILDELLESGDITDMHFRIIRDGFKDKN